MKWSAFCSAGSRVSVLDLLSRESGLSFGFGVVDVLTMRDFVFKLFDVVRRGTH